MGFVQVYILLFDRHIQEPFYERFGISTENDVRRARVNQFKREKYEGPREN